MRSQSAVEFLTTYSWAFLILGMFVVSILAIISLPNKSSTAYQPTSCYISPSFPCSGTLMATNSIASLFVVIFQNNLGTGIYFPENALAYNGIVLAPSFTSNAIYGGYCYPQNAPVGATITCNVSISGYSIPVASQVNPRFTLIYQICSPVCAKQIYNTSGTAVTVAEPYKSITYQVQLLTSPSTGSIALNGVKYPNGANVIFVAGESYSVYAVPFGVNSFSSWSVSGGANVVSTTSQSTTANAIGPGTLTANFVVASSTTSTTTSSTSTSTSISTSTSTTTSSTSTSTILYYYVPITLSNTQSSATPAPFQQMITVNSLAYEQYEANALTNVAFYNASGVQLNSWLESGNSNTSTNTIYWVNLPNGIPASSNVVIYMRFYQPLSNTQFNSNNDGEAPQLSPSYAQYDDGARVFSAYANGDTPISSFTVTSGFTLSQATGVAYGSTSINALKLNGYSSKTGDVDFYLNTVSLPASASYIAEGNGQWYTSATTGDTDIAALIQSPSSSPNAIAVGGIPGYNNVFFEQEYISAGTYTVDKNPQGSAGQSWVYGSLTYITGSSTFSAYSSSALYTQTYSGSTTNPISSSGSNIYLGVIGSQNSNYPANAYWNWLRVRAYPPNGVMPSASFGSVGSA